MVRFLNSPSPSNFQPSPAMNASAMMQPILMKIMDDRIRAKQQEELIKARQKSLINGILAESISSGISGGMNQFFDEQKENKDKLNDQKAMGEYLDAAHDPKVNVTPGGTTGSPLQDTALSVMGVPTVGGGVASSPITLSDQGAAPVPGDLKPQGEIPGALQEVFKRRTAGGKTTAVDKNMGGALMSLLARPKGSVEKYGAMPWYMMPGVNPTIRDAMIAKATSVKTSSPTDPSLVREREARTRKNNADASAKAVAGLGTAVGNAWKNSGLGGLLSGIGESLGFGIDPKKKADIERTRALTEETRKRTELLGQPKASRPSPAKTEKPMSVSEQSRLTAERNRFKWADEYGEGQGEYLFVNRGTQASPDWQPATDADAKYFQAVDKQFNKMYSSLGKGVTKTAHELRQPGDGGKFQADPGHDEPEGPTLPKVGRQAATQKTTPPPLIDKKLPPSRAEFVQSDVGKQFISQFSDPAELEAAMNLLVKNGKIR